MKSNQHDLKVSKENLFNYLNEEINQINFEKQKSGWNIWALIAALSTILWMLILQFENNSPNYKNVQIIIICVTFIITALKLGYNLIRHKTSSNTANRYRTVRELFLHSSNYFLTILLWYIIMISIIYLNQNIVSKPIIVFSFITLGFESLMLFASLFISRSKLAIVPSNHQSGLFTKTKIHSIIFIFLILIFVLISICAFFWIKTVINLHLINFVEIKISFLIVASFFIILLILSQLSDSNLLNSLTQIRRDLILTDHSQEEIIYAIDIALNGQKIDDFSTNEISEVIFYNNLLDKEIQSANQLLDLIESKNKEPNNLSEEIKNSILKNINLAAKYQFEEIDKRISSILNKEKLMNLILKGNSNRLKIDEIIAKNDVSITEYNLVIKKYFDYLLTIESEKSASLMIENLNASFPYLNFSKSNGIVNL